MLLVRNFFTYISAFYPDDLRRQLRKEIPTLSLATGRLALEVLDAETRRIKFGDAVLDPSFPLMGRLHFGVADTLMQRLDPKMVKAIKKMVSHAACGDFDPVRQLTFAVATRPNTPEGALCRFVLWEAIRLNVLVGTWNDPIFEAAGCLWDADQHAEELLLNFLQDPQMLEEDVRPLNVLVQAATECLERSVSRFRSAIEHHGTALRELLAKAEFLQTVRGLDARSAAALWPGESHEGLGSQRIADRFPQHFPSANAVEAQRTRSSRRVKGHRSTKKQEVRLIDLIQRLQAEMA